MHRRRTKEGPGPVISTSANYRICVRRCVCIGVISVEHVMRGRRKCARCNLESVWCALYECCALSVSDIWLTRPRTKPSALPTMVGQRISTFATTPLSRTSVHYAMCSLVLAAPQLLVIHKLCATDFWNAHHALTLQCVTTPALRTIFNLPSAPSCFE